MRTVAEWRQEEAARRQRLSTAREPWLRELLSTLVAGAETARRKAERRRKARVA